MCSCNVQEIIYVDCGHVYCKLCADEFDICPQCNDPHCVTASIHRWPLPKGRVRTLQDASFSLVFTDDQTTEV